MTNINGMLLKLEGSKYAMSLDLNTGYYHIQLSESASNLSTISPPRGKHCYKGLPMGVDNSPDIFE